MPSILEQFAESEMGKAMTLKPTPPTPAAKSHEVDVFREQIVAIGSHVLDGLPMTAVKPVAERMADDERAKEAAALAAERAKVEAELAAGQVELEAMQRKVAEAEAARIKPEMRRIAARRLEKGKRELTLPELRERAVASLAKEGK